MIDPIYCNKPLFEAARKANMLPPQPVTSIELEMTSSEYAMLVIRTPVYKDDLKKFIEAL